MKYALAIVLAFVALASAFNIREGHKFSPIVPYSQGLHGKEGRIVGGQQAPDGSRPFQVALNFGREGTIGGWFCGGSIISPNYILTAGHCTDGATRVSVTYGTNNKNDGSGTTVDVDEEDITTHDNYGSVGIRYDMGAIRLDTALVYDEKVAAVELSSQFIPEGQAVTASGWGLDSDEAATTTAELNFVNTVTISNTECADTYGASITDRTLCTSSAGGIGVCSGDSGGPLTLDADGRQVGVTSFVASAGCESGLPHGFSRVSEYSQWIFNNTGVSTV